MHNILGGIQMLKRILLITGLLVVIFGTSCSAMTDQEVQQAIQVGYKASDNNKDFLYNEKDTYIVKVGFMAVVTRMQSRAYAISPFNCIANEALLSKQNDTKLNDDTIKNLSNNFSVRIVVTPRDSSLNTTKGNIVKVIGVQGDKELEPINIVKADRQIINVNSFLGGGAVAMQNIGYTVNFNASDIDMTKPLIIKATTKDSSKLIFKFNPVEYGTKHRDCTDDFKWERAN